MSEPYALFHGDCLEIMRSLETASADAMVTDPPAGIGFMGAAFDHHRGGREKWVAWLAERMAEARRVVKPGHYALVWALPRTSHWTATALEDAGWIVRDRVSHIFGSGFPKHKSALKPAVEDWWLVRAPGKGGALNIDSARIGYANPDDRAHRMDWSDRYGGKQHTTWADNGVTYGDKLNMSGGESSPAGRWPSHLVLSHSPSCRRVGERRVRGSHKPGGIDYIPPNGYGGGWTDRQPAQYYASPDGTETVDAYECAPDCPVFLLDRQSGERASPMPHIRAAGSDTKTLYGNGFGEGRDGLLKGNYGDSGGASRFFTRLEAGDYDPFIYCSKASRAERNRGCEGLEERRSPVYQDCPSGDFNARMNRVRPEIIKANHHPTVKSDQLMRWLCALITPPGGVVLDPFCGSGSTGVACAALNYGFIGIEQDADYLAIARERVDDAYNPLRKMMVAV